MVDWKINKYRLQWVVFGKIRKKNCTVGYSGSYNKFSQNDFAEWGNVFEIIYNVQILYGFWIKLNVKYILFLTHISVFHLLKLQHRILLLKFSDINNLEIQFLVF